MTPFQSFRMVDFAPSEFIGCCVVGGVIFGVPVLLAIFGLARLPFFRRMRWQTVAWVLPLLGLTFGLASGLLTAWGDHEYYAARQPENADHWYEVFGMPGVGMAGSYWGDWGEDEMWDCRSDIAVLNGLFWLGIAGAGAIVFRFAAKWNRPAAVSVFPSGPRAACGDLKIYNL
jgi:hypothetical protein